MHDVGCGLLDADGDVARRGQIAEAEMAAHWMTRQAELQMRGQFPKDGFRVIGPGYAVAYHAHEMAARRLAANQVGDMPEQSADGGPQHMQNAQTSCRVDHRV